MNCYFKKSQFVRFTQFFITLEDSIKTHLGDEMLEPPQYYISAPFYFPVLCLFMLGNTLLANCFLFTTSVVSPCLWIKDMSECPPVDSCGMTLKGEEKCLWGKRCLNLSCQGCRGNICFLHLTPSQAALDILLRAVLSWHSVSNTHHFTVFLKPSQIARLNEMVANLPRQCVFILSPRR